MSKDYDFTAETLEEIIEHMAKELEKDDTFTIKLKSGRILSLKVLEIEITD